MQALTSEHRDLAARAVTLGEPASPAAAVARAAAVSALFASHVAREESLLLWFMRGVRMCASYGRPAGGLRDVGLGRNIYN